MQKILVSEVLYGFMVFGVPLYMYPYNIKEIKDIGSNEHYNKIYYILDEINTILISIKDIDKEDFNGNTYTEIKIDYYNNEEKLHREYYPSSYNKTKSSNGNMTETITYRENDKLIFGDFRVGVFTNMYFPCILSRLVKDSVLVNNFNEKSFTYDIEKDGKYYECYISGKSYYNHMGFVLSDYEYKLEKRKYILNKL